MLFNFLVPLAEEHIIFNVFRYLTFRSGGAVITALLISFMLGPGVIAWLKSKQREGQPIRDDGPESHLLTKQGTPTMGGVLILLALAISTLLWADLTNGFVWAILFVTIGFGLIGFGDDYLKLTRRSSKGRPSRFKFLAQIAIGTAATLWIVYISPEQMQTHLAIPLLKGVLLNLGWFFIAFAVYLIMQPPALETEAHEALNKGWVVTPNDGNAYDLYRLKVERTDGKVTNLELIER